MIKQDMKPDATIWQRCFDGCYDKSNVDTQTLINVDMALAGEDCLPTTMKGGD